MNTHVVIKKLPGSNGHILPGTEVDASEWRNAQLLVAQRYLKPIDAVAEPDQTQTATFAQRVIDVVKQNLLDHGELYELMIQREPLPESIEARKGRRANQS